MAYKMRYRCVVSLIRNQAQEADGAANDTVLLDVGDIEAKPQPDGTYNPAPTGPIITSLSQAVSAVMSVTKRLQSGLKTNVRFDVYGMPVGTPELGAEDIPGEYLVERLYIRGDTPNAGLLYYINRANRKPAVASASFIPPDVFPEPGIPPYPAPLQANP